MIKYYLGIGILTVLVVAAIIYGFVEGGTPRHARDVKFDQTRINDISSIKFAVENYYYANKKLPESLTHVKNTSGLSKDPKDPQTNEDYEYKKVSSVSYQICADFNIDSSEAKNDQRYAYLYQNGDFDHPKGRHCFDFKVNQNSIVNQVNPNFISTAIEDEKIDTVTTNARNVVLSNFPYGFFSSNANEHGLINYVNDPVTVTIKFKQLVKIKSITNLFTHCLELNCYDWSTRGIAGDNSSENLVSSVFTKADVDSEQEVTSDKEFSEIEITATRNGGIDSYVHWKKIKIEYK